MDAGLRRQNKNDLKAEIMLWSGTIFSYATPELSEFNIIDIANGLGNECRFNGQVSEFYSVAQHSVLMSYHAAPEHRMAALLHDAAEAFVKDIPKPLKNLLGFDYSRIEQRVEAAVFSRFGVTQPLDRSIKELDKIMLATEKRDLRKNYGAHDIDDGAHPLTEVIIPWPPSTAIKVFIDRYYEILAADFTVEWK